MKLLIVTLSCLIGLNAFAQRDEGLLREIESWKVGQRAPTRLLKFPDGKLPMVAPERGAWGDSVGDYFTAVTNADLLAAVMFDNQVEAASVRPAVRRLIELKGVGYLSGLLADRRKADPSAIPSPELAVLTQLLRSPYVAIKVARIEPEQMPFEEAEIVLRQMGSELEAGKTWIETFRKFANLHPDMRKRAQNPKSVATVIRYLFDGPVSPSGFDVQNYRIAVNLPIEHLQELFRIKRGTQVLRAAGGVYLYHITNYYDGGS